ncbi:MAG TPA: hypothetical protein VGB53_11050 [Rubricoccaceae bacterium]|jgi:hypothetical protein
MTHLSRAALALLWAAAALVALRPAAAQDVLYSETHTFTVDAGASPVVEDVEVSMTYVSPRSAEQTEFGVGEQYFNRVTDFRAEIDGRGVRGRQFQTERTTPRDVFLSGGSVQSFRLDEAPRPGQRLTYRYRRTYPDAAYLPILYVPSLDRVERYEVVVRHPADVRATFDVVAPRGSASALTSETPTEARAVFTNLARAEPLALFALADVHAAVQIDLRRGETALTPTRPDEFAAWYGRLLAGVDTTATPALRAVAESLRRATPEATVAAIHDHVRSGIRYIADARDEGAFVPRAPDIVLGHSYGDCKDRALLVATLARLVGLRVDLVLAGTVPTAATRGVSFGLYNHAICAFGEGENRVYFDPTHPYLPYGDLPEGDVGGRALRLGPGGAEDVTLAAQDSLPALDVAVRVSLDTPEAGEATVVARGSLLGMLREAMAKGAGPDAANALSEAAGEMLYKIRLGEIVLTEDTPTAVTFRARADLSEFVVASPTRRYLPQTPFRAVPPEARERLTDNLPVTLDARPHVRLAVTVVPGAWSAEPADVAWGTPETRFRAVVAPGADGTVLTYLFDQRARHFEGDARTAYIAFADRYLGARRDVFTFRPTAP